MAFVQLVLESNIHSTPSIWTYKTSIHSPRRISLQLRKIRLPMRSALHSKITPKAFANWLNEFYWVAVGKCQEIDSCFEWIGTIELKLSWLQPKQYYWHCTHECSVHLVGDSFKWGKTSINKQIVSGTCIYVMKRRSVPWVIWYMSMVNRSSLIALPIKLNSIQFDSIQFKQWISPNSKAIFE